MNPKLVAVMVFNIQLQHPKVIALEKNTHVVSTAELYASCRHGLNIQRQHPNVIALEKKTHIVSMVLLNPTQVLELGANFDIVRQNKKNYACKKKIR
jgi:hypothetical protein